MKQFLQHQQFMRGTFWNLTSTVCWSSLLILLFPVGCAVQLLLCSVVWPVRNHWKGCLSISREKKVWHQRAASAEDKQKGCLANGMKMQEPRWLQPWVWKIWGEGFSNFIYYLHGSVLCRKERRQRESLGKESRRGERKTKKGKELIEFSQQKSSKIATL